MPESNSPFDAEVSAWMEKFYPDRQAVRVIDIGAGSGHYRHLLTAYPHVSGIEIHEPYVEEFRLRELYERIAVGDVRAAPMEFFREYDLAIMGDVLEHMTAEEAKTILAKLDEAHCNVLVVVPFRYVQDAVGGVESERHLQPDLTPEIMRERYPGLQPVCFNSEFGFYVQMWGTGPIRQPEVALGQWTVPKALLRKANLAICTPTGDGSVTTDYLFSLFNTTGELTKLGVNHALLIVRATIEKGRNMLVAHFLANPAFTHLLFMDSDQGWKAQDIVRLIAHDRDIVGIAVRKKTPTPEWAVNFPPGELLLDGGLLEAQGLGTGCMLIKRSVFERMIDAYPDLKVEHHDEHEAPKGFYYTLFQFLNTEGSYLSEDLTFCKRWRDIGGKIYVDPTCEIVHVGVHRFTGSVASQFRGDIERAAKGEP